MGIGIFSFRAFDRRLARLAAPISSGVRQGDRICCPPPPAGRVRLNTPAGRGLRHIEPYIWRWKVELKVWPQVVRPRSRGDQNWSYQWIRLAETNVDTNPTSPTLLLPKAIGKWQLVTSNDFSRGRQFNFLLKLSTTVHYDVIPLK